MSTDIFKNPDPPRWVRTLYIGAWGDGKSHAAFTYPNPLVIDTQKGEAAHFADRRDVAPNGIKTVEASTFAQARDIVDRLKKNPPAEESTLIIDGISALHYNLVERFSKRDKDTGKLEVPNYAWPRIKEEERLFFEALRGLKMHVVCTAYPKDVRARAGDRVHGKEVKGTDVVVKGEQGDTDKNLGFVFDLIFRMKRVDPPSQDSIGVVLKSKNETKIKRGEEIRNPFFAEVVKRYFGRTTARNATPPAQAQPPQRELKGEALADAVARGEAPPPTQKISDEQRARLRKLVDALPAKTVAAIVVAVSQNRTNNWELIDDVREAAALHERLLFEARKLRAAG